MQRATQVVHEPPIDEEAQWLDPKVACSVSGRGGRHSVSAAAVMIAVPWVMCTVVCFVFAFAFAVHPVLTWVVAALCYLVCVALVVLDRLWEGSQYIRGATLGFSAVSCGVAAGMVASNNYAAEYWSLVGRSAFAEVAAMEAAEAYRDAGRLIFTQSSRVNRSFALGRIRGQSLHCVAPILDPSAMRSNRAEFWAVGLDCCHPRSAFYCDDATDPNARVGMVVSHAVSWHARGEYERFHGVVMQAAADFGLSIPEHPVLVRWKSSVNGALLSLWRSTLSIVAADCAVSLVVLVVAVFFFDRRSASGKSS